ncbi:MAG: RNase adapter RapZ [Paracoccaceae bacterium]
MTVEATQPPNRIVLVTGVSGAGRSTAINVLEDLGFEAIDNMPLHLIDRLLRDPEPGGRLALGIDSRNRDFSTEALLEVIDQLSGRFEIEMTTLFLDARSDVLIRRYSETRRKHPLAVAETPSIGIARDMDLLAPVRARADTIIDTSELNVHELRSEIETLFGQDLARSLSVSVQSFSYKRGLPRGVDMVFDCRFLANPYWEPTLRSLNGRDAAVQAHIRDDERFNPFFERVLELTRFLLPAYRAEGKSYLSIAFGCTGGQHRSVTMAETLAQTLAEQGQQVSIRHRELQSQHQN